MLTEFSGGVVAGWRGGLPSQVKNGSCKGGFHQLDSQAGSLYSGYESHTAMSEE